LRYAWNELDDTLARQRSPIARALLSYILGEIRRADLRAARRVTAYIANSTAVQQRIARYYQRDSDVVHPIVDTTRFFPQLVDGEYLLVISHLHPYKRVDLAVQVCTALNLPLLVVGVGPERARLERMAGPTVRFAGRLDDAVMPDVYARCRVLLQCGEEDFGIAALEAQASGRPVIAFGKGGALETVVDGVTGIHFFEQSPEAVMWAIQRFQQIAWQPHAARLHAEQFDEAHFRMGIQRIVERELVAAKVLVPA